MRQKNSVAIAWDYVALFHAIQVSTGGHAAQDNFPKHAVQITMTEPTKSSRTASPIGSWVFSPKHGESVRILDVKTVWNHTVCQVWAPRQNTVTRARER